MCMINDSWFENYGTFEALKNSEAAARKEWRTVPVCQLSVAPVEDIIFSDTAIFKNATAYAASVTTEAVRDTAEKTGLAVVIDGKGYPVRDTALKSMFDRARINGFSLSKLSKDDLAVILNKCFALYKDNSLILIDEEKVSALHSGGEKDYSVLPIPELLEKLEDCLELRFPGNEFVWGYRDHSYTACEFHMPYQKDDLLRDYEALLRREGKGAMADKLVPCLKFVTSDVGVASAKVSAFLSGASIPIMVGSCMAVDHRGGKGIPDFEESLRGIFVQFGDALEQLKKLHEIQLFYPVSTMTRVCKKLRLPKKASLETIAMFEATTMGGSATAADVYYAMQEILFNADITQGGRITLEENLSRALTLNWKSYDLAKPIAW